MSVTYSTFISQLYTSTVSFTLREISDTTENYIKQKQDTVYTSMVYKRKRAFSSPYNRTDLMTPLVSMYVYMYVYIYIYIYEELRCKVS